MNAACRTIVPIRELTNHIEKKVNLVGVVLEFSLPRKSSGTDYVSILKIVDQSQRSPELSVNIFTERREHLPHFKSRGDLILLRNVTIKEHDDGLFAIFNKKISSFALFDGKVGSDCSCYQVFGTFSLPSSEKDYISNLKSWLCSTQFDSGKNEYLLSLKDISKGIYFDLVCKVLYLSNEVSEGQWILFVWDGTDAPSISLDGKLDEEQNPLPLQVESSPLDQNALRSFYPIGTVLRVITDKVHGNLCLHSQYVGKWVRIRNMNCHVLAGMWYGSLNSSSRIRLLADDDNIVVDRIRTYQDRKLQLDRLPLWSTSYITAIDLEDVQPVTLMDLITYEKDEVVFSCVVRVVAILPSQLGDLCSSHKMRLTLEDPTGRIHALLCEEDWDEFFEDSTPEVLIVKLKRLLGVAEHQDLEGDGTCMRYPPWIKCIIDTVVDDSGKRVHYLCGTRLL